MSIFASPTQATYWFKDWYQWYSAVFRETVTNPEGCPNNLRQILRSPSNEAYITYPQKLHFVPPQNEILEGGGNVVRKMCCYPL